MRLLGTVVAQGMIGSVEESGSTLEKSSWAAGFEGEGSIRGKGTLLRKSLIKFRLPGKRFGRVG